MSDWKSTDETRWNPPFGDSSVQQRKWTREVSEGLSPKRIEVISHGGYGIQFIDGPLVETLRTECQWRDAKREDDK